MVFYAPQLISSKGPLGIVWIAAHLDRQLKRNQIIETSITGSVDQILNTEFPQLRLSSQLLLGVVRIYSRKVGYLYQECNEALVSIRDVSQKPTATTPTTKAGIATREAITLPDNLELDDITVTIQMPGKNVPPLDLRMGASTSMAVGSDVEALFGAHIGGANPEQFDEFHDGIPFDLAVDDFDRMRDEPVEPMVNLDEQPPAANAPADGMDEDLVEFNIDLSLNFDDVDVPAPGQDQRTAAPDAEVRAEAEAGGTSAAEPASTSAMGTGTERTGHTIEVPKPSTGEALTQPSESTQPELPTQTDADTQQHDTHATDTQITDTQQTEDASRANRRSGRRSAATSTQQTEDTPGVTRSLRRRGACTATPSVDASQPEASSQGEPGSSQNSAGSRGSRRSTPGQYLLKRPAVVDIDQATRKIASQLPGHLQRQLLEDRSSLLTERGKPFRAAAQAKERSSVQSLLKPQGGALYSVITAGMLGAPLQQLYCVSMDMAPLEDVVGEHSPAKKSRNTPPETAPEIPEQTREQGPAPDTGTAQPTTTGAEETTHHPAEEGTAPPTPVHPQSPEPQSPHQDTMDDGIQPTPEVPRRGDGEPAEGLAGSPHAEPRAPEVDLAPQGVEDTPVQQPTSSKRQRTEELVEEDEGDPLPLHVVTDLTAAGVADDDEAANDSVTAKSFTRRTRVVVAALQAAVEHAGTKDTTASTTGKRYKVAPATSTHPKLHLSSFVKGHNRLHASRWFFELLVLKSKGVVDLQQPRPYSDVAIEPTPKLAEVTAS